MYKIILLDSNSFPWDIVTPIIAISVSIVALLYNRFIAQRNTRLSIQQTLLKTVTDKVKDCNSIWDTNCKFRSPNTDLISEIIISIEIIEKTFEIFKKNYSKLDSFKKDYYYLFWKQLRTSLREFIRSTPRIPEEKNDKNYTQQIQDIHSIFKDFFENPL